MRISKSMIKSVLAALVLLLSAMPEAGARTCFLPDSEDCGQGDGGVSDISDVGSCRYYTCKDAGYKNDNPYQECYVENTVNIKNNKVSCYAVRCKMSQTECEEKATGTNKCCNRDVASGCYYVGDCPKDCDRSVYSYDSEQTGDGWTCISCHDGKGTFYKCNYDKTCEEQGYATSCSDEQIAEEVTSAKGQNGEKCYTCKGKPVENKTCAEYGLIAEADCDKNKNTFTFSRADDRGVSCGKCVKKNSCTDYGLVSEAACDKSKNTFTFSRADDYGNKCGTCVQKSAEPTCHEINDNYYALSDKAKYDECRQESNVYDLRTLDVSGSDGQCFYCYHRTCAEIAEIAGYVEYGEMLYSTKTQCKSYEEASDSGYVGSDGSCYECLDKRVHVVIDFDTPGCDNAGRYMECSMGRPQYISSDLSYCASDNSSYEQCSDYHKSDWQLYLRLYKHGTGLNTGLGSELEKWTLPFELKVKVTYYPPLEVVESCQGPWTPTGYYKTWNWDDYGPESRNHAFYTPRTVTMIMPKGSKFGDSVVTTVVDYDEDSIMGNPKYETVEYYIDGQKITGDSITRGDVLYTILRDNQELN